MVMEEVPVILSPSKGEGTEGAKDSGGPPILQENPHIAALAVSTMALTKEVRPSVIHVLVNLI